MTDKQQIMINGVDVSECEYVCNTAFGNIGCKLPFNEEIHCCNIPNCYFKQLARKTQECEELKRKVELMMDCPDCKVDEYKKALEEIEEYIYTDCEYNDGCDRNICIRCKYSNVHDKRILDIINKVRGCI